ncbi:MAG: single-stranded DNA-binding protein [Candidatus Izimaplasma sp.]|nr:single-stranded DNA-binding protein [Candidatus Izimaplasma bacterium]
MINRTVLVGRLTKDPELRYTSSNIAFCRFTVAVNRTFTKQNGEREADFISCVTWRRQAENMAKFVSKGSLVGVEGRIQTGRYDDNNGITRYTTDVVCDSVQFLEPKGTQNNSSNDYSQSDRGGYNTTQPFRNNDTTQPERDQKQNQNQKQKQNTPNIDVSEDDLPF